MSCAEVAPLLSSYLDELLAPVERGRILEHLASCPACSQRLLELRATVSLVAALPQTEAPAELGARVSAALATAQRQAGPAAPPMPRPIMPQRRRALVAAAAGASILGLLSLPWLAGRKQPAAPTPTPSTG